MTNGYLADALARFRAAADAAVERGRRIVDEAGAGTRRDPGRPDRDRRHAEPRGDYHEDDLDHRDHVAEPTPSDLRAAAAEYRVARGLPLPAFLEDDLDDRPPEPRRSVPGDDEDFSQFRIMRPL